VALPGLVQAAGGVVNHQHVPVTAALAVPVQRRTAGVHACTAADECTIGDHSSFRILCCETMCVATGVHGVRTRCDQAHVSMPACRAIQAAAHCSCSDIRYSLHAAAHCCSCSDRNIVCMLLSKQCSSRSPHLLWAHRLERGRCCTCRCSACCTASACRCHSPHRSLSTAWHLRGCGPRQLPAAYPPLHRVYLRINNTATCKASLALAAGSMSKYGCSHH
jgi:hypothetical protein